MPRTPKPQPLTAQSNIETESMSSNAGSDNDVSAHPTPDPNDRIGQRVYDPYDYVSASISQKEPMASAKIEGNMFKHEGDQTPHAKPNSRMKGKGKATEAATESNLVEESVTTDTLSAVPLYNDRLRDEYVSDNDSSWSYGGGTGDQRINDQLPPNASDESISATHPTAENKKCPSGDDQRENSIGRDQPPIAASRASSQYIRSPKAQERRHNNQTTASSFVQYRSDNWPSTYPPALQAMQQVPDQKERDAQHRLTEQNGLAFVVPVRRTYTALHSRLLEALQRQWPVHHGLNMAPLVHICNITDSKQFKNRDGQFAMKLSYSHNPARKEGKEKCQYKWLHLQRDDMDLREFEDFAVNAPGLRDEMKYLILKLFDRIRTTYRTKFFSGYRIEPGTVLQCKGTTATGLSESGLSVTFICFPYLAFRHIIRNNVSDQGYPLWTMLQTLYPHEPTMSRECSPTFCTGSRKSLNGNMYVPHLWFVVIGSKYLLTCSECNLSDLRGEMITPGNTLADELGHELASTLPARKSLQNASPGDSDTNRPAPDSDSIVRFDETVPQHIPEVCNVVPQTPGSFDHHNHRETFVQDSRPDLHQLEASHSGLHGTPRPPPTTTAALSRNNIRVAFRTTLDSRFDNREKGFFENFMLLVDPGEVPAYFTDLICGLKEALALANGMDTTTTEPCFKLIQRLDSQVPTAKLLEALEQLEAYNKEIHYAHRDALVKANHLEYQSFKEAMQCIVDAVEAVVRMIGRFEEPKLSSLQSYEQGTSQHENQPENATLRLPFLLWGYSPLDKAPTTVEEAAKEDYHAQRLQMEHLFTILEDIERSIFVREKNWYRLIEEIGFQELEKTATDFTAISQAGGNEHPFEKLHTSFEFAFRHSTIGSEFTLESSETAIKSISTAVLKRQMVDMSTAMSKMVQEVEAYVALFVFPACEHRLVRKMWGALWTILQTIHSMLEEAKEFLQGYYIIRPHEKDILGNSAEKGSISVEYCASCRSAYTYRSIRKAMDHLKKHHNVTRNNQAQHQSRKDVFRYYGWICTVDQLRREMRHERQLILLRSCLASLELLSDGAKKTHVSVARDRAQRAECLSLPTHLVRCFEETALFIVQVAITFVEIKDEIHNLSDLSVLLRYRQEAQNVRFALFDLVKQGKAAQQAMTEAQKAFALSDSETAVVNMAPAGPEFLIALICQNLQKRQVLPDSELDINGVYREYTSKLKYQVHRFPRKRLLLDIHALQDELTVIKWVNDWQQQTYESFIKVLDPNFSGPTASDRVQTFLAERKCLKLGYRSLRTQAAEIDALDNWARTLREQLKESVEILEEDNGKAIMVFTMITTIFLPLSFVTSFFGMNIADIRNTEHKQAFFWAIAVPVTAGIVGFAVFIAYRGGILYDVATKALHQLREDSSKQTTTSTSTGQNSFRARIRDGRRGLQRRFAFSRKRESADSQLLV